MELCESPGRTTSIHRGRNYKTKSQRRDDDDDYGRSEEKQKKRSEWRLGSPVCFHYNALPHPLLVVFWWLVDSFCCSCIRVVTSSFSAEDTISSDQRRSRQFPREEMERIPLYSCCSSFTWSSSSAFSSSSLGNSLAEYHPQTHLNLNWVEVTFYLSVSAVRLHLIHWVSLPLFRVGWVGQDKTRERQTDVDTGLRNNSLNGHSYFNFYQFAF